MTWSSDKDAGAQAYSSQKYTEALSHYFNALEKLRSSSDGKVGGTTGAETHNYNHSAELRQQEQILLSNIVACRLKIGGVDNAIKAVQEAKRCVSLDDKWAKGHIRLASAYIALGGHSNDACQALQRALSLDRGNKMAREMLVAQLRRRDHGIEEINHEQSSSAHTSTEESAATPSAPSLSDLQSPSPTNNESAEVDIDDVPASDSNQSASLSQRIQKIFTQIITWYYSQSDDTKTLIKVSLCFILLYIAMGGKFGLEYAVGNRSTRLGNYGSGNAYDRYRGERRTTERTSSSNSHHDPQSSMNPRYRNSHSSYHEGSVYNDRSNPQNEQFYSRYNDAGDYYYERSRPTSSTSFHLPNLFDGSLPSMAILIAIAVACHRFGINPFHIFWMLNMAQNRGRVHGPGRVYPMGRGGYGGYGGGGFWYGARGNRFGRRGGYY
eukprot:CCRYP_015875-RA/>CCRYP_015875-RA protein AED:0.09 eAED:0.09 QI:30/1/1/1/1/1/3/529/437